MSVIADIAGAVIGAHASKKAAATQAKFGQQALDLQGKMFEEGRADLAPWRAAGGQAIGQGLAMLQPGYDYKTSPGYDFRFNEGQRAIESSAAAKGMSMSGGTLKDLARFGDGVASADYNDQFNRMMAVAGGGQQAATSSATLGQNYANAGSGILQGIGNSKASGYMGAANSWINGINNVSSSISQIASMFGGGF
jgi:hypothetical protein